MKDYDNLVDALEDLYTRGYVHDFNLKSDCLECSSLKLQLKPQDFEIKETYRFEGMSDPSDNSVIYVIESKDGIKGTLIDAYGVYAEALTPEMAAKIRSNK
ncbi:MAG TPA: phosphoribosylpyrophosphate synthetase [Bacteroidetes bacterium]|nr:phosphoribosylpyrophosphate synthetase [Bacteroidota bacterium]